ncbi:MAG: hypothetical protein U0694_18400 [Anaerolineae bacterium]
MDDMLVFWQAIGFQVTYRQKAPSAYAVVRYEDEYELHFFGLKVKPEENFSTCLIIVPEVEALHALFLQRLRNHLGKTPSKGFPRISRMKPKQTRFTLTDVAGNSIIFIKHGKEDETVSEAYKQDGQTALQKSLNTAIRLRDFHNDDAAAAKVLDSALARKQEGTPIELARVLAARIELAFISDEHDLVRSLYVQFKNLDLSEHDRQLLSDDITMLEKLNPSF